MSLEDKYWEERTADSHPDWESGNSFLESYRISANHPHRQLVLDYLKDKSFDSLLEVGCCNGPNLYRIRKEYPNVILAGHDVNEQAVDDVIKWVPGVGVAVCKLPQISAHDKCFDFVLADACLMYVKDIDTALREMKRVAVKGLIIIDWVTPNEIKVNYSYTRNYPKRLRDLGFKVKVKKLTEKEWPSANWQKYGRFIVAVLP